MCKRLIVCIPTFSQSHITFCGQRSMFLYYSVGLPRHRVVSSGTQPDIFGVSIHLFMHFQTFRIGRGSFWGFEPWDSLNTPTNVFPQILAILGTLKLCLSIGLTINKSLQRFKLSLGPLKLILVIYCQLLLSFSYSFIQQPLMVKNTFTQERCRK